MTKETALAPFNVAHSVNTLWVKNLPFSFEHNFGKYCPILIILSLLQTEIICPQKRNWISHFTYSFVAALPWKMQLYTLFTKTVEYICNARCNSLLLHSRKFWWYLLLTSSMLLHEVIVTSYCCQRYTECLATILCSSRTVHRHTAHVQQLNCCVKKRQTLLRPTYASKQLRSQSCGLRDLGCHAASCLPQTNP